MNVEGSIKQRDVMKPKNSVFEPETRNFFHINPYTHLGTTRHENAAILRGRF